MCRYVSVVRHFFVWPCLIALGAVLGGCTPSGISPSEQAAKPQSQPTVERAAGPANKAALLVPLSGRFADDGTALLNAAQMALFDMGGTDFALMPLDTQGTPEGAAEAARKAVEGNAAIILGPLRAPEVSAVAPIAHGGNINVLSFSTDTRVAGNGVFLMGFLIQPQIDHMVGHARSKGASRFAIMAPSNDYGQAAVAAMQASVARAGATLAQAEFYDPATKDFSPVVKRLQRGGFDALLLADGGLRLVNLASMLAYNNIDADHKVTILGTMLWNDPRLYTEAALQGAFFPAPSDEQFNNFSQRYAATYKSRPPRIASLSYDATALSAILFKQGSFSTTALTNPSGFTGIDGIFRLQADGTSERAFAIKQLSEGKAVEVVPAPTSFNRATN